MYAYIKGELVEKEPDTAVIEASGVGYLITIPQTVYEMLPATGNEIKLYTHLNVKEDDMSLFGFDSKEMLRTFRLLLGVSGVGPKAAMAILSTLSVGDLRFAILAGDAKTISKAPGVGKRSAERIILELKDKIATEDDYIIAEETASEGDGSTSTNSVRKEAIEALVALGYTSSEATKCVYEVEPVDGETVETILQSALKKMAFI
ncbi:MAG: Holliday junction branch migration protein RuvA [Lachnospiraceae bacterium]|nr:Holliday junction branch migration protein RuvA [Lachnospiraceae bacterium]